MNAKDRFYGHKWGVFNHYLAVLQNNPLCENSYGNQSDWDTLVNEFDTDRVAKTLYKIGAKYYVITVMQGTKYMIAPNAAFDEIAGTKPGEACSTRDLIADLYNSLSKYGIDLFLYFTGDGPYKNHPEGDRFGFVEPREVGVTEAFVRKWASVLEEYAVRYGDKIKGWWIDGCYKEYFKYTDDLLEIYYKACKKGNPDALVALNNGVWDDKIETGYTHEDFLCGERTDFDLIPKQRFYGNAQAHLMAPLGVTPQNEDLKELIESMIGPGWGSFGVKRTKEYLADYVKKVNQAGGVVTFDIGVYRDGKFDAEQVAVLKYVGEHV
ncbi:MAG: alpha-L-fucosidase [Clostridia bacterium]|nr:alpha-L-fucosidase [Clostridia bacterium]